MSQDHLSKDKVTIRHEQEEWVVSVQNGRVVLMQCGGPFALPIGQVTIFGGCAASVGKVITAAAKRTKPRKSP